MFKIDNDTKTMSIINKDTALFNLSLGNYQLGEGDKLIFTVAKSVDLPKEEALIYVEVCEFDEGVATVQLTSANTDLEPGNYLYDIQINTKDGRVDTIVGPAKFKVIGGVSY